MPPSGTRPARPKSRDSGAVGSRSVRRRRGGPAFLPSTQRNSRRSGWRVFFKKNSSNVDSRSLARACVASRQLHGAARATDLFFSAHADGEDRGATTDDAAVQLPPGPFGVRRRHAPRSSKKKRRSAGEHWEALAQRAWPAERRFFFFRASHHLANTTLPFLLCLHLRQRVTRQCMQKKKSWWASPTRRAV